MKGEVVIPEGGITTIDVRIRTCVWEDDIYQAEAFTARVFVENYPACTVPVDFRHEPRKPIERDYRATTHAGRMLRALGLIDSPDLVLGIPRALETYCTDNSIKLTVQALACETLDKVREWGTTGWEDDIRWHKGHELTYQRTVKTRWPVDSRTTAINVKTDQGERTIEPDSLFCETCNAVVRGVILERTKELNLIINQRGEDLSETYKGATK